MREGGRGEHQTNAWSVLPPRSQVLKGAPELMMMTTTMSVMKGEILYSSLQILEHLVAQVCNEEAEAEDKGRE